MADEDQMVSRLWKKKTVLWIEDIWISVATENFLYNNIYNNNNNNNKDAFETTNKILFSNPHLR